MDPAPFTAAHLRIHRFGLNLDRGRTRFALVRSLEFIEDRLQGFISTLP